MVWPVSTWRQFSRGLVVLEFSLELSLLEFGLGASVVEYNTGNSALGAGGSGGCSKMGSPDAGIST